MFMRIDWFFCLKRLDPHLKRLSIIFCRSR
jgi:hypothetical protein